MVAPRACGRAGFSHADRFSDAFLGSLWVLGARTAGCVDDLRRFCAGTPGRVRAPPGCGGFVSISEATRLCCCFLGLAAGPYGVSVSTWATLGACMGAGRCVDWGSSGRGDPSGQSAARVATHKDSPAKPLRKEYGLAIYRYCVGRNGPNGTETLVRGPAPQPRGVTVNRQSPSKTPPSCGPKNEKPVTKKSTSEITNREVNQ